MGSTNQINLVWKKKLQLEATNEKGLKVKFDALKKYGGDESSMSPMEMSWLVWLHAVVMMY